MDGAMMLRAPLFIVIAGLFSCEPRIEFSHANRAAFTRYENADDTKVRSTPRTLSWFATMTSTRRGECVDYVTAGRGPVAQGLLTRSLQVLESADPKRIPDIHARLAFWINAYNTLVYAAALDAVSKSPSALISEGASMCYEPLDSRFKAI